MEVTELRILEVIHGYPPRYNAGSEIYTQTIARQLAYLGHKVAVFSRIEDPYRPDFDLTTEKDGAIQLFMVNHARSRDRYRHEGMDRALETVLKTFNPEIVHVNHLSHLSTGIIDVVSEAKIPIVFTLHDYWLACPRGQFLQMALGESQVYPECSSQEKEKCAIHCMSRMWSGVDLETDAAYWTKWVENRQIEIGQITKKVEFFISPSQHLKGRIVKELGIPETKIIFEPYGFQLSNLQGRNRKREGAFVFGYIGRIDPSKGIDHLIRAFGMTKGEAKLRIWGRPSAQDTPALTRLTKELPSNRSRQIQWLPEYENDQIIEKVFNRVDCIVVPSIWDENSPLVIQEALQAQVLVITSEKGGMGELIRDGVNGYTFRHRSIEDLAKKLQFVLDNPQQAIQVAKKGYLNSKNGAIHRIEDHIQTLSKIFEKSIREATVEPAR